jgi:hypothetical protein
MPRRLPTKPRRTEGVAQTCSLPYRRFAIGSRPPGIDVRFPNASEFVRYAGPKSTATRILKGFIPEGRALGGPSHRVGIGLRTPDAAQCGQAATQPANQINHRDAMNAEMTYSTDSQRSSRLCGCAALRNSRLTRRSVQILIDHKSTVPPSRLTAPPSSGA